MLKSGIYDFVICRGGTDMCFVLGFGWQRPDLKQYRISGLTLVSLPLLLFLEVLLLGLYLKVLIRVVVLFKSFLMILIMVQLIQLDLVASCLAQRHKRKCLLGG